MRSHFTRDGRNVRRLCLGYFDDAYYLRQLGRAEGFESRDQAFDHYLNVGSRDRLSPHPLFDASYYGLLYPDLDDTLQLFEHFLMQGDAEHRIPHPLFNARLYAQNHLEACPSWDGVRPWRHFLACSTFTSPSAVWEGTDEVTDDGLLRRSGSQPIHARVAELLAFLSHPDDSYAPAFPCFDPEWFRSSPPPGWTPDVHPLMFYMSRTGDDRMRVRASPLLEDAWYLERAGSQVDWHESPLEHFLAYGLTSERMPHPWIDPAIWRRQVGTAMPVSAMHTAEALGSEDGVASPLVSALIINIDALAPTVFCVRMLREAVPFPVEILILDNASQDQGQLASLKRLLRGARCSRATQMYSFGEANNQLAEQATAPWLLLLNNDAFLSGKQLAELIADVEDQAGVVAAGPVFVSPSGQLQECGGVVHIDGNVGQLFKGENALPMEVRATHDTDFVSAACLIVRRSDYLRVGGFSLVFEPAYFEDADLCLRLSSLGRVVVVPAVRVIHYEGMTSSNPAVMPDRARRLQMSSRKFKTRWSIGARPPTVEPPALESAEAVTNGGGRGSAVFYSPYGLMIGGGERFFLSGAAALAHHSHVTLAYDRSWSRCRLRNVQSELGLPHSGLDLSTLNEHPARKAIDPEVILGNCMLPPIEPEASSSFYIMQFPFPHPDEYGDLARGRLSKLDAIIVYSDFVKREVKRKLDLMGLSVPVRVVYPPCGRRSDFAASSERSGTVTIASLGRFFANDHSKRQDRLIDAFASLHRDEPDSELVLMGALADGSEANDFTRQILERAHGLPVRVLINPARRQVLEELGRSSFLWHGSGVEVDPRTPEKVEHFGIALVEAAFAGCIPLGADAGGPAEILEPWPQLRVSHFDEFAVRTREVLADPALHARLIAEFDEVDRFSDDAFTGAFLDVVLAGGQVREV